MIGSVYVHRAKIARLRGWHILPQFAQAVISLHVHIKYIFCSINPHPLHHILSMVPEEATRILVT